MTRQFGQPLRARHEGKTGATARRFAVENQHLREETLARIKIGDATRALVLLRQRAVDLELELRVRAIEVGEKTPTLLDRKNLAVLERRHGELEGRPRVLVGFGARSLVVDIFLFLLFSVSATTYASIGRIGCIGFIERFGCRVLHSRSEIQPVEETTRRENRAPRMPTKHLLLHPAVQLDDLRSANDDRTNSSQHDVVHDELLRPLPNLENLRRLRREIPESLLHFIRGEGADRVRERRILVHLVHRLGRFRRFRRLSGVRGRGGRRPGRAAGHRH